MSGLQMKYFVLKPHGNDIYAEASRIAMQAYARRIEEIDGTFACQLIEWANREWAVSDEGKRCGNILGGTDL